MTWEVEYTDEFESWWNTLDAGEQESVDAYVRLLEAKGPKADALYDEHLVVLKREGLIDG